MKKVALVTFCLGINLLANNCLKCHNGIEDIRDKNSKMMQEILKISKKAGFADNDCIVCHGGNPTATTKEEAHKGVANYFKNNPGPKAFYPYPASPWINKNTCGLCHKEQVAAQQNNLMATEQGKIHGAMWGFGAKFKYNHIYTNFGGKDLHKRFGTTTYKKYMEKLQKLEPQAFKKITKELPPAPSADEVSKDPTLCVYTYLRQECLRCHTGGKGRYKRGDYRGLGCASCHIPYSNEGIYEGGDKTIPKTPGHLLVHSIQSSRKTKVKLHNLSYSGIPVETCTTCHNRGKRIGVSYQGLMETPYKATFDENGNPQPKLHTKRYLHLTEDIHYKKGMLCQDCHTSNDMHGDGTQRGANLGAVEIECQDCHGTTDKYPWELPLGYSDEFDTKPKVGKPRGVTKNLLDYLKQGSIPKDIGDGFLLTARGNPMPKAIKKGNKVILHLASGRDITLTPLKGLKKEHKLSKEALLAMDKIKAHTNRLECYTCHATWAPQCYGCHVKIDYSNNKKNPDYLAASKYHKNGVTGDVKNLKDFLIDGKVTETRSYLRWEDPPLSQNGEGRISPTIPGCQVTLSVVGKDGKTLLKNHIFKIKDVENAGKKGINSIVMAPVNPHTISKRSRSCESCHTNPKAMGYGIGKGAFFSDPSKDTIVDLMDAQKRLLVKNYKIQIPAIKNLKYDYSVILDKNNTPVQTVGDHWRLSSALDEKTLKKLDRQGVCFSCHQSIPDGNLAVSIMSHIAKVTNTKIDNKTHQNILNKTLNISAIIQVVLGILALLLIIFIGYKTVRSKK